MAEHTELGKKGEKIAEDFLLKNGYSILERNFRFDKAEVDLIAKKNGVLAIVEVKTRSTAEFGNPQDFVKPKQIQRLVKAINQYIEVNDLDLEARFDIIAIIRHNTTYTIEHIEDAFYHF